MNTMVVSDWSKIVWHSGSENPTTGEIGNFLTITNKTGVISREWRKDHWNTSFIQGEVLLGWTELPEENFVKYQLSMSDKVVFPKAERYFSNEKKEGA